MVVVWRRPVVRVRLRCRLPAGRGQSGEIVLIGHARQARERVAQIGGGSFAVALAGDDDGVDAGLKAAT
jgi:hypothetical protein